MMDKLDVSVGLDTISRHLQSWIDFRMGCLRKGQPTFDDYNEDNLNIICPPTAWPTVGVLKNWITVLEQAQVALNKLHQKPTINESIWLHHWEKFKKSLERG